MQEETASDPTHRAAEREHWARQDRIQIFMAAIAFFAFVAASVSAFYSQKAFDAALSQANSASEQLKFSFPPKIHVINLMLFPEARRGQPPVIEAGQRLEGEVEFILVGRRKVNVLTTICNAYWTENKLPMLRPYINGGGQLFDWCVGPKMIGPPAPKGVPLDKLLLTKFPMLPGGVAKFDFKTSVPADYAKKKQSLYIMGYAEFDDGVMEHRYSLFLRKYDPAKGRFVTVKDPNYEREDEEALDDEAP